MGEGKGARVCRSCIYSPFDIFSSTFFSVFFISFVLLYFRFFVHYGMFVHTCAHSDRNACTTVAAIVSVIQKL